MKSNSLSDAEVIEKLKFMGRQAKHLQGHVNRIGADGKAERVQHNATLPKWFDDLVAAINNPEAIKKRDELLKKVAEGDVAARNQYNALKLQSYNNYLTASLEWGAQFCEIVTLGDADQPVIQNDTDQEITCYYVSRDGGVKSKKVEQDPVDAFVPLRLCTTPKMVLREWDLYKGRMVDHLSRGLDLAGDLKNMMDNETFTMIKSNAFGDFTFTGKRALWSYAPNSYIKTSNLPRTNDLLIPGATNSTKFDFAVLDTIMDYAARWQGTNRGGPDLRPTGRIRVAAKHAKDFGSGITPSGATSNKIADELLEQGWSGVNYKGISWVFIPTNTLDPADQTCYPEFNIKPGVIYLKPSGDREMERGGADDYQLAQKNQVERWMQKPYGAYINSATRRFVARVCYNTDGNTDNHAKTIDP